MSTSSEWLDAPGRLAGRPMDEWNSAYTKVESYFHALNIRNHLLLGQLVLRVLDRAKERAPKELDRTATELAAEEMDRVVTEWFAEVLQEPPSAKDHLLSTRGRLAMNPTISPSALARSSTALLILFFLSSMVPILPAWQTST